MPDYRNPILVWMVSLVLMLGLYVGAYYATAQPVFFAGLIRSPQPGYDLPGPGDGDRYRLWTRIFAPMNQLDRRLRPHW